MAAPSLYGSAGRTTWAALQYACYNVKWLIRLRAISFLVLQAHTACASVAHALVYESVPYDITRET